MRPAGNVMGGPPGTCPDTTMDHRAVIRLEMEVATKQRLDRVIETRGMTQIAVVSRLVKWLARQDEVVQASVLGLITDEEFDDLSQVLLRRLAAQRPAQGDPGKQ